jgi:hypothetical protein
MAWNGARPAHKLTQQDKTAAWDELAGADAGKAYAAVWAFADSGDEATQFLRARLKPVTAPATDRVRELIAQLGAEEFADREAAERELRELEDAAAPALQAAMKAGLSPEQARRAGLILATAVAPTLPPGARLRAVRAVAVLEWIATKDACDLLAVLTGGLEDARLTREAKAAADRLRLRGQNSHQPIE